MTTKDKECRASFIEAGFSPDADKSYWAIWQSAFQAAWNRRAGEWVSVDDRLPDPDTWLVAVDTDDGAQVHTLELNDKRQWIHDGEPTFCHSYFFRPTHWMPLPAAPQTPDTAALQQA